MSAILFLSWFGWDSEALEWSILSLKYNWITICHFNKFHSFAMALCAHLYSTWLINKFWGKLPLKLPFHVQSPNLLRFCRWTILWFITIGSWAIRYGSLQLICHANYKWTYDMTVMWSGNHGNNRLQDWTRSKTNYMSTVLLSGSHIHRKEISAHNIPTWFVGTLCSWEVNNTAQVTGQDVGMSPTKSTIFNTFTPSTTSAFSTGSNAASSRGMSTLRSKPPARCPECGPPWRPPPQALSARSPPQPSRVTSLP